MAESLVSSYTENTKIVLHLVGSLEDLLLNFSSVLARGGPERIQNDVKCTMYVRLAFLPGWITWISSASRERWSGEEARSSRKRRKKSITKAQLWETNSF